VPCAGVSGTNHTIDETSTPVPYRFSPMSLSIHVCDTVTAVNTDTVAHTWTDTGHWDSGNMNAGTRYAFRFTASGTYNFFCTYHQAYGMTGSITVT